MRNVAESTGWSRADRNAVSVSADYFNRISIEAGAWYESESEIRAGLAEGRRKKKLLAWVNAHMADLSPKQQEYITLHYFKGLSYQEIATRMGVAPSTACRTVLRGIDRLRRAAGYPPAARSKRPAYKHQAEKASNSSSPTDT